jgi:hypothetical protein
MAKVKESREQVTVNFDHEQRAQLAAIAEREHRTLAGQVRYLISRALEQAA